MPRADRIEKSVAKELSAAVALPGQSRIPSSYFKTVPSAIVNDKSKKDEANSFFILDTSAVVPTSEAKNDDESIEPSISISKTYIKNANDFSAKDREDSQKGGRYFQPEWLNKYPWLCYGREQKKAFYGHIDIN